MKKSDRLCKNFGIILLYVLYAWEILIFPSSYFYKESGNIISMTSSKTLHNVFSAYSIRYLCFNIRFWLSIPFCEVTKLYISILKNRYFLQFICIIIGHTLSCFYNIYFLKNIRTSYPLLLQGVSRWMKCVDGGIVFVRLAIINSLKNYAQVNLHNNTSVNYSQVIFSILRK